MKKKTFARAICTVISIALTASLLLTAIPAINTNAVQISVGTDNKKQDQAASSANSMKSDFVATAGTALQKSASAAPSSGASGYISGDYVNLRKGAGTSYTVLTCMRINTKFTYVDGKLYNSNWYKIKLTSSSVTGYVHKDYAKLSSSNTTTSNTTGTASGYVSGDYVNLRKGAGTNYAIVTNLRQNTKLTFLDTKLYNTNWYKVKLASSSTTGYIHKDYAKITSNSNSNNNSNTTATASGYVSGDYVNLRKGAGTNYAVVANLRKNTKLTFLDTKLYNTNWYKVKLASSSTTGYIHKDYAKITSTNNNSGNNSGKNSTTTTTTTGHVNDDYVNLRKGAGTNYSVVTCMRKNTKFTFISTELYNTSWFNIKLSDGKTGYIYKQYATIDSTTTTKPNNSNNNNNNNNNGNNNNNNNGSIKISDTSETIYVGNNYALTASGASSIKWSSSNTSVATVNSSGVVTAKKSGTSTIKAYSGSLSASCTITVKSGTNVHISSTSINNFRRGKSVLLRSNTSGVKWKSSNTSVATVNNGIVEAKNTGNVTISAYTSSGAATCLISVIGRDNIRFTYASPNSAPLNSNVTFKAITDTDRVAVRFVVSNGSTSYTVNATSKVKDGNNYIWSGTQKLSKSGKWTLKAYSKYKTSDQFLTTSGNGEGEVFVTSSTDKTTTVCGERRASDEVINLIANYEGFLSSVTADSITSDPTLGYGKVVTTNEQFYNNLTKNEAYAYLCQTVNKGGYTSRTNSFLIDNGIKFNQRQFDALVCFTYNVGASAIYNDSDLQSVLLNTGSGSSSVKAGSSGYVNASDVNLRSGAGTGYSVLTCMAKNTKFTFVDGKIYNSNWYKIKLSNGTTGYIYSSYASVSSSSRDLNNVSKQSFLNNFLQYHHAAGSCYWGLLYRRIDEAEVFFYGDYSRDGEYNKKGFDFTCQVNSSFGIG